MVLGIMTRAKVATNKQNLNGMFCILAAHGQTDVVQHFFTTQLSGFFQFNHLRLILIRTHVAQI